MTKIIYKRIPRKIKKGLYPIEHYYCKHEIYDKIYQFGTLIFRNTKNFRRASNFTYKIMRYIVSEIKNKNIKFISESSEYRWLEKIRHNRKRISIYHFNRTKVLGDWRPDGYPRREVFSFKKYDKI